MKRRQLLLTLLGVPVVGALIYEAIAKSKSTYEPVLAKSPVTVPSPKSEVNAGNESENNFLETTEEPLLRFAAIADNGFGSPDQMAVAKSMWETYQQKPYSFVLMAGDNIYSYGEIKLAKAYFEVMFLALSIT